MRSIVTYINEAGILDGSYPKKEPFYTIKRGIGKPWLNEFNKLLKILPDGAIPDVFCSFSSINNVIGRKIITARENKSKFGVTTRSSNIKVPKELVSDEMSLKLMNWLKQDQEQFDRIMELSKVMTIDPSFIHKFKSDFVVMGMNTRLFKSPDDLSKRKKQSNEIYYQKNNNDYWVNLSGLSTLIHECGHVFDNNKGRISDKGDWINIHKQWLRDGAPDLCKSPSEAFAEAFSNVIGSKGDNVPDYIKSYMKSKI